MQGLHWDTASYFTRHAGLSNLCARLPRKRKQVGVNGGLVGDGSRAQAWHEDIMGIVGTKGFVCGTTISHGILLTASPCPGPLPFGMNRHGN